MDLELRRDPERLSSSSICSSRRSGSRRSSKSIVCYQFYMTMVKYSPPRRGGELLLRTWGALIERHIQHQDIYARFTQETEIRSFRILRDQRLNLIHRNLTSFRRLARPGHRHSQD